MMTIMMMQMAAIYKAKFTSSVNKYKKVTTAVSSYHQVELHVLPPHLLPELGRTLLELVGLALEFLCERKRLLDKAESTSNKHDTSAVLQRVQTVSSVHDLFNVLVHLIFFYFFFCAAQSKNLYRTSCSKRPSAVFPPRSLRPRPRPRLRPPPRPPPPPPPPLQPIGSTRPISDTTYDANDFVDLLLDGRRLGVLVRVVV